jgi:hypothetical protein
LNMTLTGFVRFGLWNFSRWIKANSNERRNGSRKRMIEQNIFEFAFAMFFHACQMDKRRIVVNSMNRRRFENKNPWRIGHNRSMENWKGLTVANNTKRRNQENNLTFAGSCGRDFNACLFWIDWKGRTELLLNKNKIWLHHISLIRKYLIDWKAVKKRIWFFYIKDAIRKSKSWNVYS